MKRGRCQPLRSAMPTPKEFYKSMITFAAMAPVIPRLGLLPARYAALIDPFFWSVGSSYREVGAKGRHGFGNIDYAEVGIRGGTSTLYGARFPGFFADFLANTAVDVMGAVVQYRQNQRRLGSVRFVVTNR
ncbi:MAG: hypothetical protein R3B54_09195 [Bdellovibrionota bacterium]